MGKINQKDESHKEFMTFMKLKNVSSLTPKGETFVVYGLTSGDKSTWLSGKHLLAIENALTLNKTNPLPVTSIISKSISLSDDEINTYNSIIPNISRLTPKGVDFEVSGSLNKINSIPDAYMCMDHLLAIESELIDDKIAAKADKLVKQLQSTTSNKISLKKIENKTIIADSVKVENPILPKVVLQTIWDKQILNRQAVANREFPNKGLTVWDREIQQRQKFLQKAN